MKWVLCAFQVAFLCLVTACGGGGGGGGSNSNATDNDNSPRQQVEYTGSTSPSVLSQRNAMRIASNAYSLLDLVVTLADPNEEGQVPWFLQFQEDWSAGGDDCTSGEVAVREESAGGNVQIVHVSFRECEIDGVRFDGNVDYRIESLDGIGWRQIASIGYLTVESDEEKLELSGQLEHTHNYVSLYTGSLVAKSSTQQRTFKIDELSMGGGLDAALRGRFYDSVEGVTEIGMNAELRALTFNSSSSAHLVVIPQAEFPYPSYSTVTGLSVELHDAESQVFPIRVEMSVDDMMLWPYRENLAPNVLDISPPTVDRLSTIVMDGHDYFEDAAELLSFRFNLLGSNSCPVRQSQIAFDQYRFESDCYGKREIAITAYDGLHERSRTVELDVLPLAAEISPIQDFQLGQGQSFSIPLAIENLAEDGPFTYSVAQAPAGVSVTTDGVVQGEPVSLIKEASTQFTISIQADNGKQSLVEFEIEYHQEPGSVIVEPSLPQYCFSPWHRVPNPDRHVRACPSNSTYILETLLGSRLLNEYVEPRPQSTTKLEYTDWRDVNGDGTKDLVLGYQDKLVVVDLITHEVLRSIAYPQDMGSLTSGNFIKMSGQSALPYVLIYTQSYRYHLIDLQDGSFDIFNSNSFVHLFGDVDGDGGVELVMWNGQVIERSGAEDWQIEPALLNEQFRLQDVDGDGADEFVRYVDNSQGAIDGPISLRVSERQRPLEYRQFSIPSPLETGRDWYPYMEFMDIDGADGDELLMHQSYTGEFFAYKYTESGFDLLGSWSWPGEVGNLQGITFQPLSEGKLLASIDGEIVSVDMRHSQPSSVLDDRNNLVAGTEANLFKEADGYTLFVSEMSIRQSIALNDQGDIQSITHGSGVASFGAAAISKFPLNGAENSYVAVAPFSSNQMIEVNGVRYLQRYYHYGMFDPLSVETLMTTDVPAGLDGPIISGDLDRDGVLDIVVPNIQGQGCGGWYRFGSSSPSQILQCSSGLSANLVADTKLIDLDGDGNLEVLLLHRSLLGGFSLRIYRYVEGQLEIAVNHTRQQYGSLVTPVFGVQDPDADGQLEIIVAESGSGATRLSVIEQTGAVRELTVPAQINVIPDILSGQFNPSVVAAGFSDSGLNTRYYEIGVVNGRVIWQSESYAGKLARNGFYLLSDDEQARQMLTVTNVGTLLYR